MMKHADFVRSRASGDPAQKFSRTLRTLGLGAPLAGMNGDWAKAAQYVLRCSDRTDLEPLFFAPFVSSLMRVEPQWIDYNGHLNMAYYNVLFDRAVDEVYELLGIGAEYLKNHKHSTFTAEVHVRYVRELQESDPVRVTFQLLDYDSKRIPLFRAIVSRDRRMGFGNIGKHDAARRHDDEKSRRRFRPRSCVRLRA